jgi:hypothetical protein
MAPATLGPRRTAGDAVLGLAAFLLAVLVVLVGGLAAAWVTCAAALNGAI